MKSKKQTSALTKRKYVKSNIVGILCAISATAFVLFPSYVYFRVKHKDGEFGKVYSDLESTEKNSYIKISYSDQLIDHVSQAKLKSHAIHKLDKNSSLDDLLYLLHNNPSCKDLPIYMVDCAIMICVSDSLCMERCHDSLLPCYNYQHQVYFPGPLPSAFEQIAALKLYLLPKALRKGVSIFTLDLDVGFLASPLPMVQAFMKDESLDVAVQEDVTFVMDRSVEKWKTWYMFPLPNIGLLLCKGNERTVRMFETAWQGYTFEPEVKSRFIRGRNQPGKDQNQVVGAMQTGRREYGLRWAYINKSTAVLLDKVYKFNSKNIDLGGQAADEILNGIGAAAVHTTCYEQHTKIMGLKAANAYWNPFYYDPNRPTITKQLVFMSKRQLRQELQSLIWLSIVLKRSLILPNLLGRDNLEVVPEFRGHRMWPGFRLAYIQKDSLNVSIIEPGYYWRVAKDFHPVPAPYIVTFDENKPIEEVRRRIEQLMEDKFEPRLVLHFKPHPVEVRKRANRFSTSFSSNSAKPSDQRRRMSSLLKLNDSIDYEANKLRTKRLLLSTESESELIERVSIWANDSVGIWSPYEQEIQRYAPISPLSPLAVDDKGKDIFMEHVIKSVRSCVNVFVEMRGNRSCFDKCD